MAKGKSPRDIDAVLGKWLAAGSVTKADLLAVGEGQRTRILDRTARGLDVSGFPFAPYSKRGPYYYNPNQRFGALRVGLKSQQSSVRRLYRALKSGKNAPGGGMRLSRTGRTLVFLNYESFKKWLGRSSVDLRGPKAPHMLQSIVVKVRDAANLVIGIYGDFARRATGHNEGAGTLPRRYFFGLSQTDIRHMTNEIRRRINARIRYSL